MCSCLLPVIGAHVPDQHVQIESIGPHPIDVVTAQFHRVSVGAKNEVVEGNANAAKLRAPWSVHGGRHHTGVDRPILTDSIVRTRSARRKRVWRDMAWLFRAR